MGNVWERCQPMRTARSRVGVAVVNGLLYAIGGYDGQSRLSTVEVYNPETDGWTQVSSMNSQRRSVAHLVHDRNRPINNPITNPMPPSSAPWEPWSSTAIFTSAADTTGNPL